MILWYLQGVALKFHLLCYKMYQHKMYWLLIVRILVQSKMLKKKSINLDINCTFFCHMCDFVGFNNFGSNLIAHNKNLGNLLGMYWEHDRNVSISWYECVENFMVNRNKLWISKLKKYKSPLFFSQGKTFLRTLIDSCLHKWFNWWVVGCIKKFAFLFLWWATLIGPSQKEMKLWKNISNKSYNQTMNLGTCWECIKRTWWEYNIQNWCENIAILMGTSRENGG
jgi:hypothetical protein